MRVEQALVHVDVDQLGTVLDLIASDVERRRVLAVLDQPAELGGAGDVRALADVDERDVAAQLERFESRELQGTAQLGRPPWRESGDGVGDGGDVFGGRAATPS